MLKALALLILNVAVTTALYPFFINFLYKFSLRERVRHDGPKTHLIKQGTPTMGGLAFVLSVSLLTYLFNRQNSYGPFLAIITFLAGVFGLMEDLFKVYAKSHLQDVIRSSLIPVVSVSRITSKAYNKLLLPWDLFKEFWRTVGSATDVGLQTYQKFFLQSAIAIIASLIVYLQFGYSSLWLPFYGFLNLGIFYPILIYFIFIIVLNSVAFTDGLDGLAGGLAIIACCFFLAIAQSQGKYQITVFLASFIGALLPFLYFNFYPARIFMGNVGSHTVGAVIALVAILLHREVALLLVGGVFLLDGASSIFQQLAVRFTGKRIFRMAPIHHHFEMLGWPETKVTTRFYLISAILGFVGLFISLL